VTRGKNYIPGETVSVLEKEEVNLFSFRCVSSGPCRSSLLFRITDETSGPFLPNFFFTAVLPVSCIHHTDKFRPNLPNLLNLLNLTFHPLAQNLLFTFRSALGAERMDFKHTFQVYTDLPSPHIIPCCFVYIDLMRSDFFNS